MSGDEAVVQYRLERAHEALEEARLMASSEHWNTCVNRLYYACFYATTALLLQEGLASSKHTGVRALLNQHFVKPGTIDKRLGRLYNELFDSRNEGDYRDLVRLDPVKAQSLIPQVGKSIEAIEGLVRRG